MSELLKQAQGKTLPTLITPEDWRKYLLARVMFYLHTTLDKPEASVMHSSIRVGSIMENAYEQTPFSCHPAIYTCATVVRMQRDHTPPLFMRVETGALCLAVIGWDANLDTAIDKNTQNAYDMWAEFIRNAPPEEVAAATNKEN